MITRFVILPKASWPEFLNYLHIADGNRNCLLFFDSVSFLGVVLLDPHPFGGDTSTRESLFMETPVVTLPSEQLAGRYSQVGNDSLAYRTLSQACFRLSFDELALTS